jgi:hypothetical protein
LTASRRATLARSAKYAKISSNRLNAWFNDTAAFSVGLVGGVTQF